MVDSLQLTVDFQARASVGHNALAVDALSPLERISEIGQILAVGLIRATFSANTAPGTGLRRDLERTSGEKSS